MAIHHLEQKRLIYAKKEADKNNNKEFGNMIKKVPAYIQTNGFLYTMAFLKEKDKKVFEAIQKWHSNKNENQQAIMPNVSHSNFLDELFKQEDTTLRVMTMETLTLMKSFRRFVKEES